MEGGAYGGINESHKVGPRKVHLLWSETIGCVHGISLDFLFPSFQHLSIWKRKQAPKPCS